MLDKKRDFTGSKRTSEPLHIVFHEHLHGSAVDRTRTLDRHVDATGNRHVRAKKNWTNWRMGESVNRWYTTVAASVTAALLVALNIALLVLLLGS